MTPIIHYLKEGQLLKDKNEAWKVQIRATRFILIDDPFYRQGYSLPYLHCVNKEEANYVLREIHKRVCGNHAGASSLARKALRAGYYWPKLQKDAYDLVKACDQCQRFAKVQTRPSEPMTPITTPSPFAQWGINIMGPLHIGRKQYKFLIIAINYFTKWIEAEPTMTIISDNGKQFNNPKCRKFCLDLGIKNL